MLDPRSFLFITLDSCRYDTFEAANAPNLKAVGPLHQAMAPGYFTYASHAAMFVGFTPGVAGVEVPYVNPKFGKIIKMGKGVRGMSDPFVSLGGKNIVQGFKRLGFYTVGAGAAGWFDPRTPTGKILTRDFNRFYYPGNTWSLERQLRWLEGELARDRAQRVFAFLNVGETHVPYYYEGAPWPARPNPCSPFGKNNSAEVCRERQTACLEFVDARIGGLLQQFQGANVLVCADHGDAWGEDGVWEHGVHHPKVMEVPLLFRLGQSPAPWQPVVRPWWWKHARNVRNRLFPRR